MRCSVIPVRLGRGGLIVRLLVGVFAGLDAERGPGGLGGEGRSCGQGHGGRGGGGEERDWGLAVGDAAVLFHT